MADLQDQGAACDVGSISYKTLAAGIDLEENEEVDEENVRADESRKCEGGRVEDEEMMTSRG
jgi:hypothetical protein